MNWLNKLLNKEKNIEQKKSKDPLLEVQFSVFNKKAGEYNFRFMLNEKLIDKNQRLGYTYCWIISIQVFDKNQDGLPSEKEEQILMNIFNKLISNILLKTNIKIVGTITAEVFEIFFYADENDTAKIGGIIIDSKNDFEDRNERFIQWSGKEDTEWNNVTNLYDLFIK
jgi:hypothetical protein